jgi:acetylornithine deacetylase/succinyl-diaminopimelate desuccinylase-like protein
MDRIRGVLLGSGAAVLLAFMPSLHAAPDAGQAAFRELLEELVETNTTLSAGSCTAAAEKMAARLRNAGMPEKNLQVLVVPEHPKEGSLVAVLPGSDPAVKPMLLLAHVDVVEARREDWVRDPFTLVEKDGFFYARGVADDKAMAAIWVDTLLRFLRDGHAPKRTIKLALTCGEETSGAFNGAEYLATQRKDLIDAAFALNEGAWGWLDPQGKRILLTMQAGEKTSQNYRLEVTNPGGHSSRPVKDNAIYRLAAGITRISQHEFPIQLNDTTRAFFTRMGDIVGGEMGKAMKELARNPADAGAVATVTADPGYNAMLRTTCVATLLEAGHATNALPQRATANVNCRIYPGTTPEQIREEVVRIVADPAIAVSIPEVRGPPSVVPPFTPAIVQPFEQVAAEIFPGLPVVPILQAGGTDGQFLGAAGIPTYGVGALFFEHDLGGIHGLDERIRVESLYDGRDFLYELVKRLAADTGQVP